LNVLDVLNVKKKLNGSNWGGFIDPEGENRSYCKIHFDRLALSGAIAQQPSKWEAKQSATTSSSSTTSTTPSSAPRYGGGVQDKCTSCAKTVYMAEKVVMQEQVWHIDCLKCVECHKKLSGSNWGGFVPPDNKPYCSPHFLKLVQAQGGSTAFSGSTGAWVPKTSTTTTTSSDSAKPRYGGGDEERCTGCGKRCYVAEKMKMEGQTWHPACLRCAECNKMLSGANWGAFVPPDNKAYCKVHYDRMVTTAGSSVDFSGSVGKWNSDK